MFVPQAFFGAREVEEVFRPRARENADGERSQCCATTGARQAGSAASMDITTEAKRLKVTLSLSLSQDTFIWQIN